MSDGTCQPYSYLCTNQYNGLINTNLVENEWCTCEDNH